MKIILGITGASGVCLGVRLVEALRDHDVSVIVTKAAWQIMDHEMDSRPAFEGATLYAEDDFSAPCASGSSHFDAMAVIPCSMKTLAGIAHGYSATLVMRAADNALRTNRRLVLVPRETPLSLPALENMAHLRAAGAIILPPVLAFYHQPKTIADIMNYVVGKTLDAMGIDNDLFTRWGE